MNLKKVEKFWKKARQKGLDRPRVAGLIKPECEKYWTSVYYGARGSCKSIHQAKEIKKILEYIDALYSKNPSLRRAIVFTNQKLNDEIDKKYLGKYLFYWEQLDEIQHCPRKNCWKSKKKHLLHGCYLVFDDIAAILPVGNYRIPAWLRKEFSQARHFGIRMLANLQDPFSCHIDFRRYIDVAYKFTKIIGNRDPDETKKPLKIVFGIYRRRKIPAEILWQHGDLPEETIRMLLLVKEQENEQLKKMGKELDIVYSDSWKGSWHWYLKKHAFIYDTTQDIEKYEPRGFLHKELYCIDPRHNHTDKKAENYCGFKKVEHELI